MKTKFAAGIAIYAAFFGAVALSTAGSQATAISLIVLSAGAMFWLAFSVYRITQWITHHGRQPRRRALVHTSYPHWFSHFAFDDDRSGDKREPVGLIDTI